MKHLLKTVIRNVKSVKGNSLAEFATTTALMATLAATAAPKLSEMSEGAKGEKSRNEIDKIIKQAGQFYQDTADQEGRGRFPNQKKFDVAIGGGTTSGINYDNGAGGVNGVADDITKSTAHEAAILQDLGITTSTPTGGWDRFDEAHSNQWQSVFDASYSKSQQGTVLAGGVLAAQNYNANYTAASADGSVAASGPSNEWDSLFGDEVLESKFQDGHYVYTVVAGGGTGNFLI